MISSLAPFWRVVIEVFALGVLSYLVGLAPFLDEPFKSIIKWILIALAVIAVLLFLINGTVWI